jgi:hypothetical protein
MYVLHTRFEVLTAVKILMLVVSVVMPCGLEAYVPLKHWYLPTSPHDVTTQKTNFNT